jgi:hypothetical protein
VAFFSSKEKKGAITMPAVRTANGQSEQYTSGGEYKQMILFLAY